MTLLNTVLLLLVVVTPTSTTGRILEEEFSYDPLSEFGPQNWAELNIENNQCGGKAQSGIDIASSSCNEYNAAYTFNVRNRLQ
jgi:carbonic anhydrase